jgi:hypothetical protein
LPLSLYLLVCDAGVPNSEIDLGAVLTPLANSQFVSKFRQRWFLLSALTRNAGPHPSRRKDRIGVPDSGGAAGHGGVDVRRDSGELSRCAGAGIGVAQPGDLAAIMLSWRTLPPRG